jgi:hypothetical protein
VEVLEAVKRIESEGLELGEVEVEVVDFLGEQQEARRCKNHVGD